MTTRYIVNLVKVFLFYILLFALLRLAFILYFQSNIIPSSGLGIVFQSLFKAWPLDVSMACYLLFIPLLILFLSNLVFTNQLIAITKAYLIITTMLCVITSVVEIGVYRELQVKLYFGLMMHMRHLDEVVKTTPLGLIFIILGLSVALGYVSYLMLKRFMPVGKTAPLTLPDFIKSFLVFAIGGGLLVLGGRGGLRPIPINQGEVYFSENQCVNDATVNPEWNLINSFVEEDIIMKGDAYKVMPYKDAAQIVNDLYKVDRDTTIHLFNTPRPNVCILILESWAGDLVKSLGGYDSLTPNFEKLINEGYLFTNIKPTGHVSDQGVPGVLSGCLSLPTGSVINQPNKQVDLPDLDEDLARVGYKTSFFFGGQLIYGNIKTYLFRDKYDKVIEQNDLPSSLSSGRLGIHDSLMLHIWRDSINTFNTPFFSCLFTLSTHPPFDEPTPGNIKWGGNENAFLNSVIYTDRQLGQFFEEVKKTKWYNNTIFIIVADHSHFTPKPWHYESPEFNHIPLLIWGGALKEEYRGKKNGEIGAQTDIASTLLHQLNMPDTAYKWSRNLMNPYRKPWAYYTFQEGFGFVDTTGYVIWNKLCPANNMNTAKTDSAKNLLYRKGAAVLQMNVKSFQDH